jgi:hypothetical protein
MSEEGSVIGVTKPLLPSSTAVAKSKPDYMNVGKSQHEEEVLPVKERSIGAVADPPPALKIP